MPHIPRSFFGGESAGPSQTVPIRSPQAQQTAPPEEKQKGPMDLNSLSMTKWKVPVSQIYPYLFGKEPTYDLTGQLVHDDRKPGPPRTKPPTPTGQGSQPQ